MSRSLHADRPTDGSLLPDLDKVADAHALAGLGRQRMTAGRCLRHMGSGDARPPVMRPGALDAAALPSLIGTRLVWPTGTTNRRATATPPAPANAATTPRTEAADYAQLLGAAFGIDIEDPT